jgi:hypothetical protein
MPASVNAAAAVLSICVAIPIQFMSRGLAVGMLCCLRLCVVGTLCCPWLLDSGAFELSTSAALMLVGLTLPIL